QPRSFRMNRFFHNLFRPFGGSCLLALAFVGLTACSGWALNPQPLPPVYRPVPWVRAPKMDPRPKFDIAALNPQPLPPHDPRPKVNPKALNPQPLPPVFRLQRVKPALR